MVLAEFLAGLSVAAKATFGVGVAMASVTAAGAAGALPDAIQNVVASGVEAVTPFELPDSGDESGEVDDEGGETPNFGERVSTDANDGGVDGKVISEEAKLNGEANRADAAGDAGRPEDPGRAGGENPAAEHAPTSVPGGRPDGAGERADPTLPVVDDGSDDEDATDETTDGGGSGGGSKVGRPEAAGRP